MQWVGVGFHTDAMSPMWKSATTFGGPSGPALPDNHGTSSNTSTSWSVSLAPERKV